MENYVCEITATYKKLRNFKPEKLTNRVNVLMLIRKIIPKKTINYFESFGVIFLDSALNVKGYKILSIGGITNVIVDIRILFQHALLCNAVNIIIFHNHPSGNLNESKSDLEVSRKIKKAALLLDMRLIDSIIITENEYKFIKF